MVCECEDARRVPALLCSAGWQAGCSRVASPSLSVSPRGAAHKSQSYLPIRDCLDAQLAAMALPTKQRDSNPSHLLPSELVDRCVGSRIWARHLATLMIDIATLLFCFAS